VVFVVFVVRYQQRALSVKVSIKESGGWFTSTKPVVMNLEVQLSKGDQSRFIDLCLKQILPPELKKDLVVENLKGRDPGNLLIDNLPPNLRPARDEILYLRGQIGSSQLAQSFHSSLTTSFDSFENATAIRQLVDASQKGLPPWLSLRLLGRAIPLDISCFRIGLERFQIKKRMASLRAMPEVAERLLIDSYQSKLCVRWSSEQAGESRFFKGELLALFTFFDRLGIAEPAREYQSYAADH